MNKVDFLLTKAEKKDIQSLSLFSKRSFTDTFKGTCTDQDLEYFLENTYAPHLLEMEFNNPRSEVWLLKKNENIAGYIKLNFNAVLPEPQSGQGMEIQRLYIGKEFIGLGLGKTLMIHAEKRAREENESLLWLGVWEHNENAKRFYENLGFEYFGSHPFPIGNTPQVDLWMIKPLISV